MAQLEIDFDAGLTKLHPQFMDVVRHVAHAAGRPLKSVAADMDLSQSELSRKLAENPNDTRHLNAAEIPALIEACGAKGLDVIYWLIEKYLEQPDRRRQRAMDALVQMAPLLQALLSEASGQEQGHG